MSLARYCFPVFLLLPSVWTLANRTGPVMDSYISLKNYLFQKPSIIHKIPPNITNYGSPVKVAFCPFDIRHVDEVVQTVSLASVVKIIWKHGELSWNPDNYSGINRLEIDRDMAWTPTISIPLTASSETIKIPDKLIITPDDVSVMIPLPIQTVCNFDISSFPFDSQNCTIIFIELRYSLIPMNVLCAGVKATISQYFMAVTDWLLLDYSCQAVRQPFEGEYYTKCWFTMEREYTFYVVCVLAPMFLMATMTLCVFWVPAESGEKISFMVTLFVSMTVFIDFVVETIPRSMTQIPRLVKLILAMMTNLVLCVVASSFVLRRYHEQQKDQDINSEIEDTCIKKACTSREANLSVETDKNIKVDKSNQLRRSQVDANPSPLEATNKPANSKLFIVESTHERSKGSFPLVQRLFVPKGKDNRVEKQSLSFWRGMTHDKMDKVFFWFFLIASLLVYSGIITF